METNKELDHPLLDTDFALQQFVQDTLERGYRRQVWVFFLDEEQRFAEPIMPCDDYPVDPAALEEAPGLGTVTAAELFAHHFVGIMQHLTFQQLVLVWESPGDWRLHDAERRWARDLGRAIVDAGGKLRGQLLLHDRGARVIAPDDLV